MIVTRRRWHAAQQYEQRFWADIAGKIESGARNQLNWYRWKASEFEKRIQGIVDGKKSTHGKILEIGSGPIGIVNFLGWGKRFAIDPLEDFYRQSSTLTALRKPEVTYTKGTAEHLPYPDNFFSLVIIDNVLDHTYAPVNVLREIHRVLKDKGVLYLAVNVHTAWGALVHKLLATCLIDKGHPHTFTSEDVRELLAHHRFHICIEETQAYRAVKETFCRSKKIKERIKGFTGMAEFLYHVVCLKVLSAE